MLKFFGFSSLCLNSDGVDFGTPNFSGGDTSRSFPITGFVGFQVGTISMSFGEVRLPG